MRILITGGAGFIGSNLAEYLKKQGRTIIILDNLSSGRKENIPAGCRFIKGDVRDLETLTNAMKNVDCVVHLAAIVSVPTTIKNPVLTEAVNVQGSLNVLKAAKSAGSKKVVLASSAAVYGLAPTTPTKESELLDPLSPYASSKIAMEEYAADYAKKGLATVCLRFFNVYGPKQDPKSQYAAVIPAFIVRALKAEDLAIHGTGNQTRDFIFIEDVCRAIEFALTKGSGNMNIATGKSVTINELARAIIAATDSASAITHAPSRDGDPRTSLADVSKAKKELGFEARTTLNDGLKRTVEFYRKGITKKR